MGYEISMGMAWQELEKLSIPSNCSLSFLGNEYEISQANREVLLRPIGLRAEETKAVLILHYLIGISKKGYSPLGEWISIKETYDGKLFCSNFSRRAIRPLIERFGPDPDRLIRTLQRNFAGRMVEGADAAVELETFPGVRVRILFWKSDEDLPADATILFDRALAEVFTMEDLTVLLTIVADEILDRIE